MIQEQILQEYQSLIDQLTILLREQYKPELTEKVMYYDVPLLEIYHVCRTTNLYGYPLIDIIRELQKYTLPDERPL